MTSTTPDRHAAVMLRGHKIDDKIIDLYNELQSPEARYDTFLLLDETNGALSTDIANVVTFSAQRCQELGLSYSTGRLFWLCGDVALLFAYRQFPAYSYFIMIDYDVYFVKSGPAMLNAIVERLLDPGKREVDAVGLQYRIVGGGWPHHAAAKKLFEQVWFYYFPFIVLSRRALAYVHAQRRLELYEQADLKEPVICEAFVPSHLTVAGFYCIDLEEILPGAYDAKGLGSGMRLVPFGLPLGASVPVGPAIEMIHPVYSVADYLARSERLKTRETIEQFLGQLRSEAVGFIDPALREGCERQLLARLAQLSA
jgi:hypothetical protein